YFGKLPARGPSESLGRPWLRRLALAGVCLLQASAGVYYAAFACFLIFVAGIAGGIERRRLQPLAVAGLLIALTAAGVAANIAPSLIYWARHGRNPEVAQRSVYQAELFGLKIAQLVLPTTGHRWRPLAELRDRYHHSSLTPNENDSVTLGTVGAFGFAALVFRALFMRRRQNELLDALSTLNLAALMLATIGGFGVMFNLLVDPSIRCYNRIGVFLGFFALTAIAHLMQPWAVGWGRGSWLQGLGYGLLGAVLVLGVLDQAPPCLIPVPNWVSPDRATVAEQFRSDAEFVARIEAIAPPGAMIYQIPYVNFPESTPYHGLGPYDQFRPYLHSKRLRWSFGSMQGRETDLWRRSVARLPMPEQLAALRQVGFSGVMVCRLAFTDDGRRLEGELNRLLDAAPLVSRDQKLAYFPLDGDSTRLAPTSTVAGARP
ncbi:MAG TPA: hypothetical protein VHB99_01140, partial [Pirellulales bacterium]|nr:hypothetical protein [Pirellulales bacterium]